MPPAGPLRPQRKTFVMLHERESALSLFLSHCFKSFSFPFSVFFGSLLAGQRVGFVLGDAPRERPPPMSGEHYHATWQSLTSCRTSSRRWHAERRWWLGEGRAPINVERINSFLSQNVLASHGSMGGGGGWWEEKTMCLCDGRRFWVLMGILSLLHSADSHEKARPSSRALFPTRRARPAGSS